jgi:ATP-dependent DNA helicase MPH1
MAYSFLKSASEKDSDDSASASNKAQSKRLRENDLFKKLMSAFEACKTMSPSGFPPHPKMEKTVNLLVDYYGQRLPDSDNEEGDEDSSSSKAMVFVTHREAVDEIVEALNAHRPMIRASRFIGQGTDRHGNRGQAQKEQLEVLVPFEVYAPFEF